MTVTPSAAIAAPIESVWAIVSDPERALSYMSGVTRWEVVSERADRPRRPLPDADAGRLGRGRRPDRGRRVGAARASWPGPRSPASTSAAAGGCARRPGGRTRVEIRLAYGVAGSGLGGWLAERIAGPAVTTHLRPTCRQLNRLVEHEQLRDRAAARRAEAIG